MRKVAARRSSLFLLELLIAILFFALTSAVCIQVFVQSHLKAVAASDLTWSMGKAQNAAEGFYAADGVLSEVQSLFPESTASDSTLTAGFDESWNSCAKEEASYFLTLTLQTEAQMHTGEISVTSADSPDELYHLTVKKHQANRRADYEP